MKPNSVNKLTLSKLLGSIGQTTDIAFGKMDTSVTYIQSAVKNVVRQWLMEMRLSHIVSVTRQCIRACLGIHYLNNDSEQSFNRLVTEILQIKEGQTDRKTDRQAGRRARTDDEWIAGKTKNGEMSTQKTESAVTGPNWQSVAELHSRVKKQQQGKRLNWYWKRIRICAVWNTYANLGTPPGATSLRQQAAHEVPLCKQD